MKRPLRFDLITKDKIKGHWKTINDHKILVMKHCFQVGLYRQGLMHDLSKYMPSELLMGFMYYDDGKGSPNNGERKDKTYSYAWMHHKGRNRHHFEYWLDYSMTAPQDAFPMQPVQMPRKYVVEMLMDRISASKNYNKETYKQTDPLEYYERGKGRYIIHPQTGKELHGMLRILAVRGEDELIRFVKDYYLKGYPI